MEVEESAGSLRVVIDALDEPILMIAPDHSIRFMNRAAQQFAGVHPDAQKELFCHEVSHNLPAPCDDPSQLCPLRETRKTREPLTVTHVHPGVAGKRRHLEIVSSPIWDDEGQFLGIVQSARDVTEQRTAQRELAEERARLDVTLRACSDALVATDAQGRITLMNSLASALTGWTAQEAAGKPVSKVFSRLDAESRRHLEDAVQRATTGHRIVPPTSDQLLVARTGEERLVRATVSPISDPDGSLSGAVITVRDVTQERRAQDELARAQHLESLGILAGGIAHDFNNILMAIAGNIALAQRSLAPDDRSFERLAEAKNACFRATELTHQLLTFARGGEPVKKALSLAPVIEEWVRFALRGSNVRGEVDVATDVAPIEGDEGQIHQAISNLIINAQQATPRGGAIRVRLENTDVGDTELAGPSRGHYVRLVVEDKGVGIPPEHVPRIFDPYFTTKQTGSGPGLAIAYSVAQSHGGHIEVSSALGKGSTFSLYLPASDKVPQGNVAEAGQALRGSGRVLVMDDEPVLRGLLADILEDMGYEAELAVDGEQATEMYRNVMEEGLPFDCAILDLTVQGGMSGIEALGKLREYDPAVRAIASSGYAADPVMADFRRYGFANALAKPYRTDQLARVLQETLSER